MKNSGTLKQKNESNFLESTEISLLEDIKRGDQQAFTRLVTMHEKSVYRICYRFFVDESEAADATQEVFLKVFRAIGRFEGRSSLKTWIYRIAANTCITLSEKKKREKEGLLQSMVQWWNARKQDSPEEEILEREVHQLNQQVVSEKVAKLSEIYRMPVILKDIEGFSLEKISEILEIPVGTVKSRINRGRRLLQESLQAYMYGRIE